MKKLIDTTTKSKILPFQNVFDYVLQQIKLSPIQIDLINETKSMFKDQAGMQCSPEQVEFFRILTKLTNAKKGIEVGTFTGLSALSFALGLPQDGQLICCDVSKEFTDVAKKYWALAGVDSKINLILGPALETIKSLTTNQKETFDFGFIDADKENYQAYYEGLLNLIRPGGYILIDNVLWKGTVAESESELANYMKKLYANDKSGKSAEEIQKIIDRQTAAMKFIKEFNEYVVSDIRVESVMLTIADGLTVIRKK